MRSELTLTVTKGPHLGREFRFDSHDIFIFGRSADCRCSLPDDGYLSAHHFMIEVNPPDAELRDLGSKNGTLLNGRPCGRREKGESAEAAAGRARAVAVRHGDVITAGAVEFQAAVSAFARCGDCGGEFRVPSADGRPVELCRCPACTAAAPRRALPEIPQLKKPAKADAGAKDGGGGLLTNFLAGFAAPPVKESAPEFPGYRVEEELKEGGMGKVYLASRLSDGRPAVIKVIRQGARKASARQLKLFRREMRVAASLRHPNIVEFYEDGAAGEVLYFAMAYCGEGSAQERMASSGGRLDMEEAVGLVLQALEGLEHAHGRGMVHRDLKPDNILLAAEGGGLKAKIADFGLAKGVALAGLSGMTASGDWAGTPAFMPREQLQDFRGTRPVSDVFSMGASLYAMLTGKIVYDFKGVDPCAAILRDRIVPIRGRGVKLPEELVRVVERAIAPDAKKRYPTAGAFKEALDSARRHWSR